MPAEATSMSARSATGRTASLARAVLRQAPDERLVALVREGSAAAFEEISARYRRRLHAYCVRLVGPAHAEDVVQQALLRAYLSLRRGDLRHVALRAWLYRIARNCAIDLLRSRPPDHEQLDLEFDGVPQPPRLVEQKEEIGNARRRHCASCPRDSAARSRCGSWRDAATARSQRSSARRGRVVRQLIFRARETLRSGLGALVPAGFLRRLAGSQPPIMEAHHAAVAAKLSSGGALEAVGAMAAATITLLAGCGRTAGASSSRSSQCATDRARCSCLGHRAACIRKDARDARRSRRAALAAAARRRPRLTGGAGVVPPRPHLQVAVPAAGGTSAEPRRGPGSKAVRPCSASGPATRRARARRGPTARQPAARAPGPSGATGPSRSGGPGRAERRRAPSGRRRWQ